MYSIYKFKTYVNIQYTYFAFNIYKKNDEFNYLIIVRKFDKYPKMYLFSRIHSQTLSQFLPNYGLLGMS